MSCSKNYLSGERHTKGEMRRRALSYVPLISFTPRLMFWWVTYTHWKAFWWRWLGQWQQQKWQKTLTYKALPKGISMGTQGTCLGTHCWGSFLRLLSLAFEETRFFYYLCRGVHLWYKCTNRVEIQWSSEEVARSGLWTVWTALHCQYQASIVMCSMLTSLLNFLYVVFGTLIIKFPAKG